MCCYHLANSILWHFIVMLIAATVAQESYIHARLTREDRAILDKMRKMSGCSESELVRRGLRLALEELGRKQSALELAGRSAGKFRNGPRDLATDRKHLEGFGE